MKKILLTILGLIFGLSLLIAGLWLIDYYIYSWHILRCDAKTPSIKNKSANPYGKDLGEKLDLTSILNQIRKNPSYKIIRGEDDFLVLERLFEEKPYVISLNHKKETTMYSINGGLSPNLIPCSTPNYRILMNAYQMIDELPLTDEQKKKLKDLTTARGYRGWSP
jgi:hypothetical protein